MSRSKYRVVIPRNAAKILELATKVAEKHVADGAASKLSDVLTPEVLAMVVDLKAKSDLVTKMRKDVETLTEAIQLGLGIRRGQQIAEGNSLLFVLTSCRDILIGHNKGQEQKLGDHGYEVNRSTRKRKGNDDKVA